MIIKTLITARGNSKSIPNKNILDIKNKPLIAYSIEASKKSYVSETWVSTDCKKIKEISLKYGAKVLERPKELATDTILNEPSLIHFAKKIDFDLILFIQPTSPFINSKYINEGINLMKTGKYDSVFTATKKHWVPHWDLKINPIGWDIYNRPRRQEKEEYYEENGMFYITSKGLLLKNNLRYGGKIGVVNIPSYDSFQIDNREDLELIRRISC
tara:strand:- start:1126 stop:1767 length:642 start_codon:yes stop_codon:yes gene_type:complete